MKNKILDLYARCEFWYAIRFIKLDKHYTFFFDLAGEKDTFAVKYLKQFKGVIVEFGNIRIGENNGLNFDYDIVANPNNHKVKSKRFDRFTQNVMRSIFNSAVQNGMREENENRNIDPVESDSERTVHEEVAPVSQKRVSSRKPRKKTVRRNKAVHSEVQQSPADSSVGNKSEGVDKTN